MPHAEAEWENFCAADGHPEASPAEILGSVLMERQDRLIAEATQRGCEQALAEHVIETVEASLQKELLEGADWWRCPRGTCRRRIARRVEMRFRARVSTALERRRPTVSLEALAETPGPLHRALVVDAGASEFQSVVEAAVLGEVPGRLGVLLRLELARMRVGRRRAMEMFVDGHDYPEIAAELGVTEANARQRVCRAREQLQGVVRAFETRPGK